MDVVRDVLSHSSSPLDPADPKNIRPDTSYGPYAPSISSSVSSSVVSPVFSVDGASSQSSVASSACSSSLDIVWETDVSSVLSSCRDHHSSADHNSIETLSVSSDGAAAATRSRSGSGSSSLGPDQRRNRRRSNRDGCSSAPCARPPPSLVRQSERRLNFVDGLVDSAAQMVEVIWPLSNVAGRNASALGCRGVLPLKTFIQETLRRSRTSYSTLQVALYYLISIKHRVPKVDLTMEQPEDSPSMRALQCGRRMFLAALILASKYLQDRNYSARAWSKISGLSTQEINMNEMTFLEAINWRLHVSESVFQRWTDLILKYTTTSSSSSSSSSSSPSSPSTSTPSSSPSSPLSSSPLSTSSLSSLPSSWSSMSPVSVETKKVNWTTIVARLSPEMIQRTSERRSSLT